MDTQSKFGLKKSKAILLFIQMLAIIIGTVLSGFVFGFLISASYGGLMLAGSLMVFIAYVSIIVYAAVGYRKSKTHFLAAVGIFAFAVVINIMVDFRTPFQLGILTVLFGALIAFMLKQDNPKLALYFILTAALLSLVFSIYSAITANPQALGNGDVSVITIIAMYASLFAPTIMSCTFAITHAVHMDKLENL